MSPLSGLMQTDTSPSSHPVAARDSRTNILHSSGEGSDGRDHSSDLLSMPNSSAVRPPASAGADQAPEAFRRGFGLSRVFVDGPLDYNAGGHIPPDRDKELSCQSDDCCLALPPGRCAPRAPRTTASMPILADASATTKEAERLLDGSGWLPEPLHLVDVASVPAEQESEVAALPEFLSEDENRDVRADDRPQLDAAE